MRVRDPKEMFLVMGKISVALVGALVLTALTTIVLPFSDFDPLTPGRVVRVGVFYTAWALLAFKLLFGEFVPRNAFGASDA